MYFDPENPTDIARALRELIESPELRKNMAAASFERAKGLSWVRCADETFGFLGNVSGKDEKTGRTITHRRESPR